MRRGMPAAWTSSPGEAARERARGLCPAQVDCDRDPDEGDAQKLEAVAEPPAELHVVEDERRDDRGGEERQTEHDQEVGEAAGYGDR